MASLAQGAGGVVDPQDIYTIDVDRVLASYGLGGNDRVVKINADSAITLTDPLVIMGGGADTLEKEGFAIYTGDNPVDAEKVLGDEARTFQGKSIEEYDLIVVGGPEHNAYAKELLGRGVITYGVTDLKMPGLVVESAGTGNGHTILAVGDVDGYAYHNKDLPLNGILPEKYAATTAVLVGMGAGLILSVSSVSNFFSSLWDKIWKLIYKFFITYFGKMFSKKESEARKIGAEKNKKAIILGLSAKELWTALFGALMFGIAFLVANRLNWLPGNVWIYILTGGITLGLHELGHSMIAARLKVNSEYQFWGMGTIVLMLTAWLFGLAFATSGRFMMDKKGAAPRSLALITLTGPAISLVLSILFLPLVFFGGLPAQIGLLGFSMNLVTAVYNLMPFIPMDGKSIFTWSKLLWALLFVPVTLFFIAMTFFVLG